ncbi:MAG: iron-containing alcohol dehydrogenase [Acidobacteriota bacterium]
MAPFDFATAGRIVFGRGTALGAADLVLDLGRRVLVVTGATSARAAWLVGALEAKGADCRLLSICNEPDVAFVSRSAEYARTRGFDVVVATGGGSALDAGKAIAALTTSPGDPLDYLEVVGRGHALQTVPLPFVAIPTTAGTGSEVTRNAVLSVPGRRVKVSLRSPLMLPRLAIVDPGLTDDLPSAVTASTGLDALTQLIEPFLSTRATPVTDAFCRAGIPLVARSLRRAYRYGHDLAAREDMALASLFGGMALANAGLGAVHGLAAPIGGMFAAPHGAVCAALVPHVFRANLQAIRALGPAHPARPRLDEIARLVTGRVDATADDAADWLLETCRDLGIAPLSRYGISEASVAEIVAQAGQTSSMKGNPVPLTGSELAEALRAAM